MESTYIPCRVSCFFIRAGRFFLLLLFIFILYGCATVEPPPPDETFLQERSLSVREKGALAYTEGDYQRSLFSFSEAFEIDRRRDDKSVQISDLIGMGRAYTGLGQSETAHKYLTKAVTLSFSTKDDKGLANAYSALAESYFKEGKYSLAIKNINDAISLNKAGERESSELYNLAAIIYLGAGRLVEADAMINSAMKLPGPVFPSDSKGLAHTFRVKARILSRQGDITTAMSYFTMAYAVDFRLKNEKGMALDLWDSALVFIDSARYSEAVTPLKKSFTLYRKGGFIEEALRVIDKLVEVYRALEDKSSESYYRNMREALLADMR